MPFLSFIPFTALGTPRALIDFTLSKARRFYSSMGKPLAVKGIYNSSRPEQGSGTESHEWLHPRRLVCNGLEPQSNKNGIAGQSSLETKKGSPQTSKPSKRVLPTVEQAHLIVCLFRDSLNNYGELQSAQEVLMPSWRTEITKQYQTYLRASFCKYRKSRDSFKIFNFFVFCPNKPFSELFSKT